MSHLLDIITASDPAMRNRSLDAFCNEASATQLLDECAALDAFRRSSDNLYERVRALFFLYAIYRFHLPPKLETKSGFVAFDGYANLLKRRFDEAIEVFLADQKTNGASDATASALATAYHRLGFQTLADQVRRSVRSAKGNQWMFRTGHPADHPLRVRPELYTRNHDALFPILREATPVRMDLTHSGWSDIFFLGMDFPEGARVLNISIDLAVRTGEDKERGRGGEGEKGGRGEATVDSQSKIQNPQSKIHNAPKPPIETYFRIIDQPILRLVSVDLGATAEISSLAEVFDFAKDYTGLIKAAVIASGIVPPGIEGADQPLSDLLARLVGPGYGIELVSQVNGIPKGSRLAVSTNLLASLIAVCMRATGQTQSLTGQLNEEERRIVAARAILGEWIGGSGGGWQDSGGVWPAIKLIQGVEAGEGDPEYGVSRGRLLPNHTILDSERVSAETRRKLQESLVLVHGGMAQDVGPILEMVTEKYLLRSPAEWQARLEAIQIIDQVVSDLQRGDVQAVAQATQRNFFGPIQTIIPWASNLYTETLISQVQKEFGEKFWGFWMLGGMSGGGMGFIFEPSVKAQAQERLRKIMSSTKQQLEGGVPFAMEPVVYDFAINERGTWCDLLLGEAALMPAGYYTLTVPRLVRTEQRRLSAFRRAELDRFGEACRTDPSLSGMVQTLFDHLLPRSEQSSDAAQNLEVMLDGSGFDRLQHEQIRADLRSGRIGLAQNRLPVNTRIEDVGVGDVVELMDDGRWTVDGGRETGKQRLEIGRLREIGTESLRRGELAVVSLAGGAGSRWTSGAGVVKALNPFARLGGKHRNFIEVHMAKSRRISQWVGTPLTHIITTSYLTHAPIEAALRRANNFGYPGPLVLSPGRSVGLRLLPMARDLRFAWEEMPQQLLDEQAQKMQDSAHAALIEWAGATGEGSDYTDNLPKQCLHPTGHWFEIPNLLRNGVLAGLLRQNHKLKHLMIHNVDTLGADADPAILGQHIARGAAWTNEVITRRLDDRGGGLARINGQLRLVEGLALPREEVEFALTYYNTSTIWIDIDQMLNVFGLERSDLLATTEGGSMEKIDAAVRSLAARMPTYITLKDVKKRWGKGQEDIFPVAQFEKLWGDMTGLAELDCQFVAVSRMRGQQLKEVDQLDGWLRDGSAAYVEGICEFGE